MDTGDGYRPQACIRPLVYALFRAQAMPQASSGRDGVKGCPLAFKASEASGTFVRKY